MKEEGKRLSPDTTPKEIEKVLQEKEGNYLKSTRGGYQVKNINEEKNDK